MAFEGFREPGSPFLTWVETTHHFFFSGVFAIPDLQIHTWGGRYAGIQEWVLHLHPRVWCAASATNSAVCCAPPLASLSGMEYLVLKLECPKLSGGLFCGDGNFLSGVSVLTLLF